MNQKRKNISSWLTSDLRAEISSVFTSRYKKLLSDSEIEEIAINLTSFMKIVNGGGSYG